MFGTVIIDAYTKDETEALAYAIDDICCPSDNYGWASAGIYYFWDYNTHEVLYIGLASDLYERFRQHNGLLPMQNEGCKYKQIQEYFMSHTKLGYSIFVQSPLSQPIVHRNKDYYEQFAAENHVNLKNYTTEQGIKDIKRVEGILIEAYRKSYGHFPKWNKVGGSIEGQQRVMKHNINIVKSFSNPQLFEMNPIVSRSTIRELSDNPTYEGFESFLHAVRMCVLLFGMDYYEALKFHNEHDSFGWYHQMCSEGYMNKKLIV